MAACNDNITEQEMKEVRHKSQVVYDYFLGLQLLTWIISMFIIFVLKYKSRKHVFVKVIYVLITLMLAIEAVIGYYLRQYNYHHHGEDVDKDERVNKSIMSL